MFDNVWWWPVLKNLSHLHFIHRMCEVTSFYHDEILMFTKNPSTGERSSKNFQPIHRHISLLGPLIEKQYHVLRMHTHSFPWLHDFNAYYRLHKLRNHLNIFIQYHSFSFFNKCKTRRSSQQWEKIEWTIVHVTWLFRHIDGLRDSFQIFAQWDSVQA